LNVNKLERLKWGVGSWRKGDDRCQMADVENQCGRRKDEGRGMKVVQLKNNHKVVEP
jgi:hypothetical protein